jgi:hypothetical protein
LPLISTDNAIKIKKNSFFSIDLYEEYIYTPTLSGQKGGNWGLYIRYGLNIILCCVICEIRFIWLMWRWTEYISAVEFFGEGNYQIG